MADQNSRRGVSEDEQQHRALSAAFAGSILARFPEAAAGRDPKVIGCLLAIQRRAMASLDSLTVLIDHATHDYHHDGAVILRGLYDIHLQFLYLMTDPEVNAVLYTDYLDVQNFHLWKTISKNNSDIGKEIRNHPQRQQGEQNVIRRFKSVEPQFLTNSKKECRKNWYKGTLADLATKVRYLSEYELMQQTLSNSVHSTPYGLTFGAAVDPNILLNYAWAFNFRIIGAIADYLGVTLTEREQVVVRIARHNLNDRPSPDFGLK